ncbi:MULTISPECIES: hypothetical protein [unclassified Variovorax]|uniref:hypothetical protein n=1 Tax=unclassified Variovorax TaxID=663243 RepID=UPI0013160CDF|nr:MULTISPECIES: hypothetical protein [unclassified Variovorax]VTU41958.1 hypothetical protein SRS16P1_00164 [Variovorax sp. SRS16]VTU41990.1 hypothetical protein E5P1_00162 [Variovorax sp. PBL-E5]VTU44480.1 hypothetical protein H6P1_00770 [Variovorax sp. PBL-H6]
MESLELKYRRLPADASDSWEPLPGTFRSAANNWLVVHDLFHHLPHDRGSLAEELATLGAEYYVNYEGSGLLGAYDTAAAGLPTPGLNALTRSAAGVVGMAYEAGEGPEVFDLRPTTAPVACELAESVFVATERSAVAELEHLLWGMGNEPEWQAAKKAFCTPGLVASWVRQGYQGAKARYPDQARARAGWNEAVELLFTVGSKAQPDAVLVASRRGYSASFEVVA